MGVTGLADGSAAHSAADPGAQDSLGTPPLRHTERGVLNLVMALRAFARNAGRSGGLAWVVVAASGNGADFVDEEGGLFPCGEVAAAAGFVPVHDVGEAALGLAAG